MNKEQAKKKVIRRLLGTLLILAACVIGGGILHAPRQTEAKTAVVEEAKTDAVKTTEAETGSSDNQFIVYFLIGLIVFIVIISAVIAVVSTISSVSAAISDEEDGEG